MATMENQADALQRAIFNSVNFSSIATDAKGVIQIFNVGAERMLGYAAVDVAGVLTPADLSVPQEIITRATTLSAEMNTPIAAGFEALVFKAARGIEDIYELTYICKDGTRLPAIVSVTALRDCQDAIIGYLLIGTDNSERKKLQKKLDRVERLASLSTLVAGVAHEINQPLQVLKVTADGMVYSHEQGKAFEADKVAEKCRRISRQVDRISNIVNRLRDFVARSHSERTGAVDLNDVRQNAVELLRERMKVHNIRLREQLSAERPTIWGNSARLEEIFINLLVNAIQAMDLIDAENKEIVITTTCQNEKVLLEISNNGPAIPEDIVNTVFTPFFTTKINQENMGLGLSIVHSIVTDHRGKISVANQEAGVSVQMEFPRHIALQKRREAE